ncbi:MAG: hypothetical protein OXH57_07185 [Ekhidna sp.]|nr:hypothetical protein [Ekhidna sp.]
MDESIKSYSTKPLNEWNGWYSWQGFYAELQKHIGGNWGYVSNPAGGFLGFWWHWKCVEFENKKFEFYLQLEYHKLIFKLYTHKTNERKKVRDIYRRFLFQKAKELNIPVKKYGRIGKWMGVAILEGGYRVTNENGTLDFDGTLTVLKQNMNLLDEVKKEITAHSKS